MKGKRFAAAMVASGLIVGSAGAWLAAIPAVAASGQTGHGTTFQLDFSNNPKTSLEPPAFLMPPLTPLVFPNGCPIDDSAVFMITGNGVDHMNGNKNGFWTGQTGEGTGTLPDQDGNNPDVYTGQFTGWGGFGTNIGENDLTGQMEGGTSVHFHGAAPNGDTIDLHID